MIKPSELRLGNRIMYKVGPSIKKVICDFSHFAALAENANLFYPIVLKPDVFIACGFIENRDYPLAPSAQEFILTLPVMGTAKNEIAGYAKTNGECFARATLNGQVISNNVFHLHALQNLYYALTGAELGVKI